MDRFLRDEYTARVNRVQDYIENHLDRDFTLENLADKAHFSKFHFHRIFFSITGETLFQFIQRVRIEKAAALLLYHPRQTISAIAMNCGFSTSSVFARVFKDRFGVPASTWRSLNGQTEEIKKKIEKQEMRIRSGSTAADPVRVRPVSVTVVDVDEIPVVYIRYIGPYQGDQALFDRLYSRLFRWARARDLYTPGENRVFCLAHDNPTLTADSQLRISCCLSIPTGIAAEGEFGTLVLPAGRYARAEFLIDVHEYGWAWAALFRDWLPESGYQPGDSPAFEEYIGENEPREKQHVLIWLPVKPL